MSYCSAVGNAFNRWRIDPIKRYAIIARIGAGVTLTVCWGLVDSPLSGVVFILLLAALSIIRYRFAPYRWLSLTEIIICTGYAFLWFPALLGLWLPVIGLLEDKWDEREQELLKRSFEDRGERLKLEDTHAASAREIQNAARLAEIAERARLAQDIHDHVGHEISGASIALQTAIKLYEKNDPRAGELFSQSAERLGSASEHLREAVHNLKPAITPGISSLKSVCDAFPLFNVDFTASGDLDNVPHWELLESNLKEALTNVSRHSNATQIAVRLDGNVNYIRMQIMDNGKTTEPFKAGLGLSGMKDRIRAVGGTLTVNTDNGFQIVCVIPKGVKE